MPLAAARLIGISPRCTRLLGVRPADLFDEPRRGWLSREATLACEYRLAMCYAGHQFGHFVPQLGGGRAVVIDEATTSTGECWEIQLKGVGLTPCSRDGDGRVVLGSTIREYLCAEAMSDLGIPTTRALYLFDSDEQAQYGYCLERTAWEPNGATLSRDDPV